jgi:PAS domain S-box-containing protein
MAKDSEGKYSQQRTRPEEIVGRKLPEICDIVTHSPEEIRRLFHELRVHQIELEMQNEDLRDAQIKLEELKDKYLDLYDFSPVGYITLNEKGLILEANLTAVQLLGEDKQTLINRRFSRFLCQGCGDAFHLHLQQVFEAQSKQTCEIRLATKDGTQLYAQLESVALKDENGQSNRCRTVLSDITEHKRTVEELRETSDYLENLIGYANAPIIVWNQQFKITRFNRSFEALTGRKAKEVIGHSLQVLFPSNQDEASMELVHSTLSGERWETVEISILNIDGSIRTLLWNSATILAADGLTPVATIAQGVDITDRKMAEQVAQEHLRFQQALIDAIPIPVFFKNTYGKYLGCNEPFAKFLGMPKMEIVGKSVYDISPKHLADVYHAGDLELLNRGGSQSYESRVQYSSGTEHDVIFYKSTFPDVDGAVGGLIGAILDITDLKMSENLVKTRLTLLELAASHSLDELLQKTLDEVGSLTNSPIGFYHFISEDEKTIYLQMWSSRTVKEFCSAEGKGLHYPVDQGGVWVDAVRERRPVIHNDYATLPHRKGMPEGHAPLIRELVVPIMRSDKIVAILGIGNKPTDYSEKDIEIVSYLADVAWEIAERKRAEEALKESDKQYRTLFEDSIDGVYSVLRDGEITDANASFCELFGYTREEMIGKDIQELYVDPADRPRFQEEIEEKGFVKDYEIQFQNRNGVKVDCLVTSSVIFERDGSITGYRGIIRDLTARKALHKQLLQAQKMEAVGTLAGGIAHDFNNILQVVLGYSELLLADENLPDGLKNDLGKVILSARNGAELVHRLLMFSRKTDTKPLDLDLNKRIRQTQNFLERTIPKMINIEPGFCKCGLGVNVRWSPFQSEPCSVIICAR